MSLKRWKFIFDRTLSSSNFIERALATYGDRPFVRFDEPLLLDKQYSQMSVSELLAAVNRGSNTLQQQGLQRFSRVAICKSNSPDYFVHGNAAIRAGGIAVPINAGMQTQTLIAYLNYVGARILITDIARFDALQAVDFRTQCAALDTVFLTDGMRTGALSMQTAFAGASDKFRPVDVCRDEDILIVHTSGTTGVPKGVLHTDGSYIVGLRGMLRIGALLSQSARFMSVMPFNHYIAYQGIGASLIGGNNGILVGAPTAPRLLDLIQEFQPAAVFCFPHSYADMYDYGLQGYDLSSVKYWMAGADSSHEAHIREFVKHGSLVKLFGKALLPSVYVDTLGSSEVGFPAFRRVSSKYSRLFARCIGSPLSPGPRVKVADEHGNEVPRMQLGRMMVKGPTLFKGYWNAHDRLHGVVKDGWWWTGDMGYRDRQGRYFHLDRDVDLVQTRGGAISTLLLEERILNHPQVSEAVVVGRSLSDGDVAPYAYVQLRRGAQADASELLQWVREGLPAAASRISGLIELQVVNAAQIPRGLTGKVLKRELQRQLNHV
jgi:acyl-coenzyme A synthetase/AMP-(fatty) acid ligase